MAFVRAPALPSRRPRASTCGTRPSPQAPRMLESNTIIALVTVLAGVGGGIGLVAWTEQQGIRTEARVNTQKCVECGGATTTVCSVCGGTGNDPIKEGLPCSYCEGKKRIRCFNCAGSGIQPRFLDRYVTMLYLAFGDFKVPSFKKLTTTSSSTSIAFHITLKISLPRQPRVGYLRRTLWIKCPVAKHTCWNLLSDRLILCRIIAAVLFSRFFP